MDGKHIITKRLLSASFFYQIAPINNHIALKFPVQNLKYSY